MDNDYDAYADGGIILMGFELEENGADTETSTVANPDVNAIFMDGELSL